MAKYILLLRNDPSGWEKMSPEDMQKWMQRYIDWNNKPYVVQSDRLDSFTGRVMQKKDGKLSVTDGPYGESHEVLGGYYTIEAKDFDEAVKLSSDHPHAEHGTVEIREIMAMPEHGRG